MTQVYTDSDPIAHGAWSPSADIASEKLWQKEVGSALGTKDIFAAGVYFGVTDYNISNLARNEQASLPYVRKFCSHNYPQSAPNFNLSLLMSHAGIKAQIEPFENEYKAAQALGKPYIFGETNSGQCAGHDVVLRN